METYTLDSAQANLSKLVDQALQGQEVVIVRNAGKAVRVLPYDMTETPAQRRLGGQWAGKIWMAPDFDAFDAEIEKMFEESEIFPEGYRREDTD